MYNPCLRKEDFSFQKKKRVHSPISPMERAQVSCLEFAVTLGLGLYYTGLIKLQRQYSE